MSTLADVLDLWLNNAEFREKFKKNPKDALESEGLELNETDFKKIQSYLESKEEGDSGKGSNQELDKRISK